MKDCCEGKADDLAQLRNDQASTLKIVLMINAVMFVAEFAAGILGQSTALLGDSLDMFGDAAVYAMTLYVIHRSSKQKALAALTKGVVMLVISVAVMIEAVNKTLAQTLPAVDVMIGIAAAALIANTICAILLFRRRKDDLNMKSVWLCSRNDLLANTSVILAAGAVWTTGTFWPDVVVGVGIAILFASSSFGVIRESWSALKHSNGSGY